MTAANVLPLLQVDLGELYLTDERKNYLSQVIDAAIAFITREGITLEDTVEDLQLVEMYSAYLVRKRNTTEAMPRMLRWALNNRLFSQKSGG